MSNHPDAVRGIRNRMIEAMDRQQRANTDFAWLTDQKVIDECRDTLNEMDECVSDHVAIAEQEIARRNSIGEEA